MSILFSGKENDAFPLSREPLQKYDLTDFFSRLAKGVSALKKIG